MNDLIMHSKRTALESASPLILLSSFLARLRQQKIMINKLLRWCSCGLAVSFILIVRSAIPLINKLSLTRWWASGLLPVLLFSLIFTLIFLEYRYSEKCVRDTSAGNGDIKLHPAGVRRYTDTKKRLIVAYLAGTAVICLLISSTSFSGDYFLSSCFLVAGLLFYLLGLYLLKVLLKKKCEIRRLLDGLKVQA
jgi:hypothetical protein